MSPLPDRTRVVVLVTKAGVSAVASNIAGNLEVIVVEKGESFYTASLGLPFNSTREPLPAGTKVVGASFENVGVYVPQS